MPITHRAGRWTEPEYRECQAETRTVGNYAIYQRVCSTLNIELPHVAPTAKHNSSLFPS